MKNVIEILDSNNSREKIKILSTLNSTDNLEILEKIISKLDDKDISVRGEAFSSLVSNNKEISNVLIKNLNSENQNIKAFILLILANRKQQNAIKEIIKLAKDANPIIRANAIAALGHLKVIKAKEIFLQSIADSDLEVRKNALYALILLDTKIPNEKIIKIKNDDKEVSRLLLKLKNMNLR